MFGLHWSRCRSLYSLIHEHHSFQLNTSRYGQPGSAGEDLWEVSQISRPCHFATGWRTERIINLQCSSSELFSFPTVSCPIRYLIDFLVVWVSYTETKILHCCRGNSGRENMSTSLKTVTRQRATAEVFWYLNLHWLHCTLTLAYRAVQQREDKLGTVCCTVCLWLYFCLGVCYLPAPEQISVRTVLTFSSPTSSLWEVGRNFKDRSTSPTRSCPESERTKTSAQYTFIYNIKIWWHCCRPINNSIQQERKILHEHKKIYEIIYTTSKN